MDRDSADVIVILTMGEKVGMFNTGKVMPHPIVGYLNDLRCFEIETPTVNDIVDLCDSFIEELLSREDKPYDHRDIEPIKPTVRPESIRKQRRRWPNHRPRR